MTHDSPRRSNLLRRLLSEVRPYRRHLAAIFCLDLVGTPVTLLTPIPLKIAVDTVLGSKPLPGFLQPFVPGGMTRSTVGLLVVAGVLQLLIVFLGQLQQLGAYVLRTYAGEGLTLRFRARLFRHAQRLSLAFHDARGTADALYRIQYDAPAIQWVAVYGLMSFAAALVTLAGMVYVTARIDWQLAVVALGVVPPLFLLNRKYNLRMRPRYLNVAGIDSSAMGIVQEVLGAFRVVKAFGREDKEEQRFVARSAQGAREKVRLSFAESTFGLLVTLTTAAGTALVLFIGVRNVQAGVLTLGELLMVVTYLTQLYAPLQTVSKEVATLQSSLASAQRAFDLLDQVPDVVERPHARPLQRARGELELRDVSFCYDGTHPVLKEVSFRVPVGTRLGIAGRTGAGKTTLISLITRFFDPTTGAVLLDGVDLRDYRLADLSNQFSVVLQEPVLFSTTIAENIAYARPDATFEEVVAAARAASAHEFIGALPEGYTTRVGERGMRLSGGERQRISLARAFLRDAPVLILDEPTSSVDRATEHLVVQATRRLMEGRTTLIVSHRPSMLRSCTARMKLEDGEVVQLEGLPDTLPAAGAARPLRAHRPRTAEARARP